MTQLHMAFTHFSIFEKCANALVSSLMNSSCVSNGAPKLSFLAENKHAVFHVMSVCHAEMSKFSTRRSHLELEHVSSSTFLMSQHDAICSSLGQ
jgi:hypothetical protein